jgi:hypothetical protein
MTRQRGGTWVAPGYYWNAAGWEMATIPKGGGVLPGAAEDRYVRVPPVALLVLAPTMGLLFAIFLPFIGFAMVIRELWRRGEKTARTASIAVLHRMGGQRPQAPAPGLRRAPAPTAEAVAATGRKAA